MKRLIALLVLSMAVAAGQTAPVYLKGDKGDTVKGDKGDAVKGDKGEKGDAIPGPAGPAGPQGIQGIPGPAGPPSLVPGPSGAQGIQGIAGKDGIPGKDGAPGLAGKDGAAGTPGQPGQPGAASTIPGPAGKDGVPGINGKDGAQGLPGAQGPQGLQGVPGRDGTAATSAASYSGPGVYDSSGTALGDFTHFNGDSVSVWLPPVKLFVELDANGRLQSIPLSFATPDCSGPAYIAVTGLPGALFLVSHVWLSPGDLTPLHLVPAGATTPTTIRAQLVRIDTGAPQLSASCQPNHGASILGPFTVVPVIMPFPWPVSMPLAIE